MNVPTPLSFHEPPEARISHLLLVELAAWTLQPRLPVPILMLPLWAPTALVA